MRKKTHVALFALLGLLLFGCGKKVETTTKKTTKTTPAPIVTTQTPAKKTFTVNVVNSIQNAGTVSGTGEIEEGKTTTLKAVAADGYTFLGFYDGETELTKDSEYTITVTKAVTITAKWTAKTYTFAVKSISNVDPDSEVEFDDESLGKVEYVNENENIYSTGEKISLKATPEEGYQFNGWYLVDQVEGDHLISDKEEYDFTMLPQNTTLKAKFGTKKCTIEMVSNIEGAMRETETCIGNNDTSEFYYMDELEDDSVVFDYGVETYLYAEATSGYSFKGFYIYDESGDYSTQTIIPNAYYFNAVDSVKFVAYYEPIVYELYLYVSPSGVGAGTINATYGEDTFEDTDEVSVAYNTTITLAATAGEGYTFVRWFDWGSGDTISEEAVFDYLYKTADNLEFGAEFANNNVDVNIFVDTVDGEGNPVATATIDGECKFNNTIHLMYSDLNPAYDYVGLFYSVYDETIEDYTFVEIPGLYDYSTGFAYKIQQTDEINLYFKFELGQRTTHFYTNIEELVDTINGSVQGTYGDTIDKVAPTPAGYTFVGWIDGKYVSYDADDKPYLVSDYEIISAETECPVTNTGYDGYWCWYTRNQYKVYYDRTSTETISKAFTNVYYGLNAQLEIPTTSVNGQVFDCWEYVDSETGDYVEFTNSLAVMLLPYGFTSDIHVSAKWSARDLTVTFETDGGTEMDDVTVTYGNTVTKPADPEKDGYTFAGWYNADNQEWVWSTFTIINDTVIYAHWTINEYTISISSANEDAVTVNSSNVNGTYDFDTELELRATVAAGYSFDGWYEGSTKISSSAVYTYNLPSHDVTLVAKYTVNKYTVTVFVLANYSDVNVSKITYTGNGTYEFGKTATITTVFPEGDDYHYVGAYRSTISGSNLPVKDEHDNWITDNPLQLVVPARNFSVWIYINSRYKTLTVSKSTNTGSEGTNPYYTEGTSTTHRTSDSVYADRKITLHAFDIAGYTFAGWYDKASSTLISSEQEYQFTMPYSNLNYEARYNVNKYTLTLVKVVNETDGETVRTTISSNQFLYKQYPALSISAMTGYTFRGWYISGTSTCVSTNLSYSSYMMPKNNVTIEAIFDINNYEVLFGYGISNTDWNLDAGTVNYDDNVYYYGDYNTTMRFEAEAYTGWTFKGYYQAPAEYSFDRANLSTYTLLSTSANYDYTITAADVTVFAVFEADVYYITLNENGGTLHGSDSIAVFMGDEFELEVPTPPTDRVFIKWTYTSRGTTYDLTDNTGNYINYYNFPVDAGEITAKAIYGTAIRTITFETGYDSTYASTDTKTFTSMIESGTAVTKPADPIRKGYTFDGWFTEEEDGDEWIFTTPISADKTLYAHWTVNTYTVTLSNYYTSYGHFDYKVVDTSIMGTVDGTPQTITVTYGQKITVSAVFNLGRQINYWQLSGTGIASTFNAATTNTFTLNQACDITIRLWATHKAEMAYYNFTSTATTCNIQSLTSAGKEATTLIVPDYVTDIMTGAFTGNNVLTELTLPFTGNGRDKDGTSSNKTFTILFGTTSGTGLREVQPYWMNGTTHTAGSKRYIPESLETVTITDETKIADCAFENAGLTNIYIECSITSIGKYAFKNNMLEMALSLPNTLTTIGDWAFQNMTNRESYTVELFEIPNSVTYIGQGALVDNDITSLVIPFVGSSYTATGNEAVMTWFYLGSEDEGSQYSYEVTQNTQVAYVTRYLQYVTINPDSAHPGYVIKAYAFQNMVKLSSVEHPYANTGSVTLPAYAFDGCEQLTNIYGDLFYKMTTVGDYAFRNCKILLASDDADTLVTLAHDFNTYAFYNCGIRSIETDTNTYVYVYEYSFANSGLKELVIANDVVYMYTYDHSFENTKLTDFDVTARLHIGHYAFSGCTSLESISCTAITTSNKTGKLIGNYAFKGCTNLVEFAFSTMNTTSTQRIIGDYAFEGCTKLETVVIPSDVQTIGTSIFKDCESLKNITVPFIGPNNDYTSSTTYSVNYIFGYFFSTTANGNMVATTFNTSLTYYLPNVDMSLTITKIKVIAPNAFYGYSKLVGLSITGLANGVTTYEIGNYSFYATGITTPTFCSGLTQIQTNAFSNSKIATLNLPDSVTYIGTYAFRSIPLTGTLELPSNTNLVIDTYAFMYGKFNKLNINKFSRIKEKAIFNNNNLTEVHFNYGTTGSTFGQVEGYVFLACYNSNLSIYYFGQKAQFNSILSNGNFATDWNCIKKASGSEEATYRKIVICSDGNVNL